MVLLQKSGVHSVFLSFWSNVECLKADPVKGGLRFQADTVLARIFAEQLGTIKTLNNVIKYLNEHIYRLVFCTRHYG